MPLDIRRSLSDFLVKRRLPLFMAASLTCLLIATGIPRNSFDTSLGALLTESDPYLEEMEILQAEFPPELVVTFAFVPTTGDSVFQHAVLDAIADLGDNYQQLPSTQRFSSLLEYYSPEQQARLFTRPHSNYSSTELEALQGNAVQDRLLVASLLAENASLSFARVVLNAPNATAEQRLDIADAALALRDELRARHPEIGIHVNSEVILEQASEQAMIDDLTTLLPIIILICVLAICYCFRSIWIGICILSHTIFTLLCTVGVLGYLGFALNSISIIAPLVVVIIAVANSVHLISIYKQSLHRGRDKATAMRESIAYNLQPITLAALTTAIGFSSLNLCSSPAIQDFGRIVAIGIGFAYVLTLFMLPAILIRLTRIPVKLDPDLGASPWLNRSLQQICSITWRHDKFIFAGCTGLALLTAALLPLNETDFDRMDFIATDSDIALFYEEVDRRLNRGPSLSYAIDTHLSEGAIEPEFLNRVETLQQWLLTQAEVESVASVVDLVKTVNRVAHSGDMAYDTVPQDINDVSNYLNAYKIIENEDFPLASYINNDQSMISLLINAVPMSNQELIDLDLRIGDYFETVFPAATLVHGSGTLLFSRMDELVTIELLQGYSISLLLITLSLIIGLRSLYFGILSVLPNLLPATIVFGMWALFVGQLDPFVMMLFSISIGLVVDDTVHILSHYLEHRREGEDKTASINHSIRTAGPALTITTFILALGTTILIGASTLYFQQAAQLLVPIVVLALALDLFYLPTILRRFDYKSV